MQGGVNGTTLPDAACKHCDDDVDLIYLHPQLSDNALLRGRSSDAVCTDDGVSGNTAGVVYWLWLKLFLNFQYLLFCLLVPLA